MRSLLLHYTSHFNQTKLNFMCLKDEEMSHFFLHVYNEKNKQTLSCLSLMPRQPPGLLLRLYPQSTPKAPPAPPTPPPRSSRSEHYPLVLSVPGTNPRLLRLCHLETEEDFQFDTIIMTHGHYGSAILISMHLWSFPPSLIS